MNYQSGSLVPEENPVKSACMIGLVLYLAGHPFLTEAATCSRRQQLTRTYWTGLERRQTGRVTAGQGEVERPRIRLTKKRPPRRRDRQSMRTIYAVTAHTSTKEPPRRRDWPEWVRVVIHKNGPDQAGISRPLIARSSRPIIMMGTQKSPTSKRIPDGTQKGRPHGEKGGNRPKNRPASPPLTLR